jgi:hypothetical protein
MACVAGPAAVLLWCRGERRIAKLTAAVLLLLVMTFIASSRYMQYRWGHPSMTPQTKYLVWDMFFGSFQFRTEPWDWRFWDKTTRQGSADYQAFSSTFERLKQDSADRQVPLSVSELQWVENDVRQHPFLHLRMAAVRALFMQWMLANSIAPASFHLGPLRGPVGYWLFHFFVNYFNLLLVVMSGKFVIQRSKDALLLWVLWAPWVALLVFHSGIYGEPRFIFPGQPGLMIIVSLALTPFLSRRKQALCRYFT